MSGGMKHIACDCEHKSHFVERDDETGEPLGPYEHHAYGREFDAAEVELVATMHGVFHWCKACRADHPLPKEFASA